MSSNFSVCVCLSMSVSYFGRSTKLKLFQSLHNTMQCMHHKMTQMTCMDSDALTCQYGCLSVIRNKANPPQPIKNIKELKKTSWTELGHTRSSVFPLELGLSTFLRQGSDCIRQYLAVSASIWQYQAVSGSISTAFSTSCPL